MKSKLLTTIMALALTFGTAAIASAKEEIPAAPTQTANTEEHKDARREAVKMAHEKARAEAREECMDKNPKDHDGFKKCMGEKKAEFRQKREERKAAREARRAERQGEKR